MIVKQYMGLLSFYVVFKLWKKTMIGYVAFVILQI